jgi:hypothetical protein
MQVQNGEQRLIFRMLGNISLTDHIPEAMSLKSLHFRMVRSFSVKMKASKRKVAC